MTLLTLLLQEAAAPKASGYSSIIMMVALIAIFYFFMIRPQSKRQKEIRKFREALTEGQKVITARWYSRKGEKHQRQYRSCRNSR